MIPVVTPAEMAEIDRAATEPVEVLIERAGAAVAAAALDLLGGTYGRRVTVVAGKGNNGNDGIAAARRLERRGVRCTVLPAADAPPLLPPCDLVIDAAYGTGFRGKYDAPAPPPGAAVLAVDIPSGVDGVTGEARGQVHPADVTVTFVALKPGLLLADGRDAAGDLVVADIGLRADGSSMQMVEPRDLGGVPRRPRDAHKYHAAVAVVGGSPTMLGAAELCGRAALRAGAGYVRMCVPGTASHGAAPRVPEAVLHPLPAAGWAPGALDACERMRAAIIGPGLGREPHVAADVESFVTRSSVPLVVDADGIVGLGPRPQVGRTDAVLTPHDGEFTRLMGAAPGADRVASVRDAAAHCGATILLKGSTTIVADPDGDVRFATSGTPALATAGTGDVLAGVIAALVARGVLPLEAAALAALVHGMAARRGHGESLVAGDLPDLIAQALA